MFTRLCNSSVWLLCTLIKFPLSVSKFFCHNILCMMRCSVSVHYFFFFKKVIVCACWVCVCAHIDVWCVTGSGAGRTVRAVRWLWRILRSNVWMSVSDSLIAYAWLLPPVSQWPPVPGLIPRWWCCGGGWQGMCKQHSENVLESP